MPKSNFGVVCAVAVACVLVAPMGVMSAGDTPAGQAAKLRSAITLEALKKHQIALQQIANENGGTRATATPGYDQSVAYLVKQLRAAGYAPVIQTFNVDFFQELAPSQLDVVAPTPAAYSSATLRYSASGDVTAALQEVSDNVFPPTPRPSSTAGCEASDFAGFVGGRIALIQRGTCTFQDKALNAQAAGASAVVIFNEGQPGRTDVVSGTLDGIGVAIPVVGTDFATGDALHRSLLSGPVTLHVETSTVSEARQTANVIAETRDGDPNRVVVQGSHLDSVSAGAGINDNGSGASYNLESAIQMAQNHIKPRNRIRFAWWGAAEQGLLGSLHYVNSLSDVELGTILLNLNYDTLASRNFGRFVYDGDGEQTELGGPAGSAQIEKVFLDYFASVGLPTAPTPLDGKSDYVPFIERGVPAGGLFSGADGLKSEQEAVAFGGVPGVAYDPCYHQACDDITNLSDRSFVQLSHAAATALVLYGLTKDPVTMTTLGKDKAKAAAAAREYRGSRLQR